MIHKRKLTDRSNRYVPWQRNIRVVPEKVRQKILRLGQVPMIVAGSKRIPMDDARRGVYAHLHITVGAVGLEHPASVVPPSDMGTTSRRNVEGWEEIRKDLPMIKKSFPVETPNFGDWSYGSHTIWFEREVYQREYHEPRDIPIKIETLKAPVQTEGDYIIKFSVGFVLDPGDDAFKNELKFCLNLLQENTGLADIHTSAATREDFLGTITLDWEIFPPGTVDEMVRRFGKAGKSKDQEAEAVLRDRVETFARLKPRAYVQGVGGLNRYIGAKFDEDLIVFENVRYGNALYVLYDDWEDVSKRSRIDLIRKTDAHFDRIVHGNCWKEQLDDIIRRKRRKRAK